MSVGLIGIAVIVGIVIFSILYGYALFLRSGNQSRSGDKAKCILCERTFDKSKLVERAVGIEKLYYFCGDCIKGLYEDYKSMGDGK